jgi:Holliday junction DNA helicase RuvA
MISRLRGTVAEIEGDSIIVDVQGVGYAVTCTSALLAGVRMATELTVCIYTDVREDSIRLFGFESNAERQVFLLLNRVSGMGPRSSLDVISNVPIRDLLRAIGSGDVNALMSIKGVGKKKAERIVVELKDLVGSMADERSAALRAVMAEGASALVVTKPSSNDAVSALEVLGFPRRDAEIAVSKAMEGGWGAGDVGDLVREALRFV